MLSFEVDEGRLIILTGGLMAQIKLSKEKVINLARAHITLPPLNAGAQRSTEEMYELLKTSMLEERPWPFCLALTTDIQSTDGGENLNYSFKYRLPADALGVVALNPNERYTLAAAASNYDLLRVGLSPGDDQPLSALTSRQDFYFKAGILYSNVAVNEILYKRDPDEREFSTDFMLSLSWQLAKYLATSAKGRADLAAHCEREASMYHARAYRHLTQQFPGIDEKMLRNWIKQFYGRLYY